MLNMKPEDLKTNSDRPTLETGQTYPAMIDLIVDLGDQRSIKFGTKDEEEVCREIWIGVCFPTEVFTVETDDGELELCQVLGKQVKIKAGDRANITKIHKAVCKSGETIQDMLGKPCSVVTGLTSGNNLKIDALNGPIRGSSVKLPANRELTLITEDDWDNIDDAKLPDFIKGIVKRRVGGPDEAQ